MWFCGMMLAVASSFVCKYSHVLHGVHKPSQFGGVLYQADFLPAETVSVLSPAPRGVPVLSQTLPNLTHTQLCLLMVKSAGLASRKCCEALLVRVWGLSWPGSFLQAT